MPQAEKNRLRDADEQAVPWRRWGPYLSERQWGTVREDATRGPNSWSAFSHEQARSRAYRWGEDGLAGFCDDRQILCLSLALWNGARSHPQGAPVRAHEQRGQPRRGRQGVLLLPRRDAHLVLREDALQVPAAGVPVRASWSRRTAPAASWTRSSSWSTPASSTDDRYVDVVVEYAKASPEDVLMLVTVTNRSAEAAELRVLPTLWFRHTWSWAGGAEKPALRTLPSRSGASIVAVEHAELAPRWCCVDGAPPVLMTNNETNDERVFGTPNATPYVKDGIDRYVVARRDRRRGPGRRRDEGRLRLDAPRVPGGERRRPAAAHARRPCRPSALRGLRRRARRAAGRGGRVLRRRDQHRRGRASAR